MEGRPVDRRRSSLYLSRLSGSERRLLAVGRQPPPYEHLRLRLRPLGGRQGRRERRRRRMGLLRRPGRRERRRLRERPRKEALRRRRGLGRELGQLLGQVGLEAAREAPAAAHRRRVGRRVEASVWKPKYDMNWPRIFVPRQIEVQRKVEVGVGG